jgi:hypothetical protein
MGEATCFLSTKHQKCWGKLTKNVVDLLSFCKREKQVSMAMGKIIIQFRRVAQVNP